MVPPDPRRDAPLLERVGELGLVVSQSALLLPAHVGRQGGVVLEEAREIADRVTEGADSLPGGGGIVGRCVGGFSAGLLGLGYVLEAARVNLRRGGLEGHFGRS